MEYSIVSRRRASSLRRNENFYSLAVEVYFQAYFKPLFCETLGIIDIYLFKGRVVWGSVLYCIELGLGLGLSLYRYGIFNCLMAEGLQLEEK